MSIVLPIVFFVVVLGLSVRRVTAGTWCAIALGIAGVIAFNYFK